MKHFGIAFGVITASVVVGALMFDRSVKDKEIVVPGPVAQAPSSQVAASEAVATPPADVAPAPAIAVST